MSDKNEFELIKREDDYALRLPGIGLYAMDNVQLYKLAQIGTEAASLFTGKEPPVGPYVVTMLLVEDEDDSSDDDEVVWHARTNDSKLAQAIKDAARREMRMTSNMSGIVPYIPCFPSAYLRGNRIPEFTSVADALADLRVHLMAVPDGPRTDGFDFTYWNKVGFSSFEADSLSNCCDNGLFEDADYDSDLMSMLDSWLVNLNSSEDELDAIINDSNVDNGAFIAKLRRWINGEVLTAETSDK